MGIFFSIGVSFSAGKCLLVCKMKEVKEREDIGNSCLDGKAIKKIEEMECWPDNSIAISVRFRLFQMVPVIAFGWFISIRLYLPVFIIGVYKLFSYSTLIR